MKALKNTLGSRLAAYAAAGTVVALTGVAGSHAAVIIVDPPDIPVPTDTEGVYINFVTGTTGTSSADVPGFDFDPYDGNNRFLFYWGGDLSADNGGLSLDGGVTYARLGSNVTVGPAGTFLQVSNGNTTSNFTTATGAAYLGVKFLNESTGAIDYGYVHLSTTTGNGYPATILDYAYEDTGAAITTPNAVPEPTSTAVATLGLLALGATGLRRWRQQNSHLA